jgi:hypothetical protein
MVQLVGEGVSVKPGFAVTVRAIVVVAVNVPEVPVMVIEVVAAAAVLATVNVSTLVLVVGLVP